MRAEVLGRDAARDREDLAARDRVLERVRDLLDAELLALEVLLHQRLVGLDDLVEQLLAVLLDELCQLLGDRPRLRLLLALRARVRAHVEDVDDPGQLVLAADRQLDGDAAGRQLLLHLTERAEEVGALAVEHVDEEHAGDPELVGALPDPRRADLDPHDAAERRTARPRRRGARSAPRPGSSGRRGRRSRLSFRPCHSACVSASAIDILRCCSSSSQSATVEPASIVPRRFVSPAWNSSASTSEVLPVPR